MNNKKPIFSEIVRKLNDPKKSLKAFTLVEMMVVAGIFSIILGALFSVLTMGSSFWYTGNAELTVQGEARRGMNWVVKELRPTADTQLQTEISLVAVDFPADGNYYGTIIFKLPYDVDGDGDVLDADGNTEWGGEVTYSLGGVNGEQLLRTFGGSSQILANNISGLQFRRSAATPEVVEILIEAAEDTPAGWQIELTLYSKVKMRN